MASKRPKQKHGINTGGRASCLGGRNKNFKAMLDQQTPTVDHKLADKLSREKQLKTEKKKAAEELQREHGMIDESQVRARDRDSRRQYKQFLDTIFVTSNKSAIYNDKRIFRTKEAMQLYYQRTIDPAEWQENVNILESLQQKQLVTIEPAPAETEVAVSAPTCTEATTSEAKTDSSFVL